MKIVACTRSYADADVIGAFCASYLTHCDKILIANGMDDATHVKQLADLEASNPKIEVRPFFETVSRGEGGFSRNPHGKHINFLLRWAIEEEGADWVIFDDSDCFPSFSLRDGIPNFFSLAAQQGAPAIFAHRYHIWMGNRYLPDLNKKGQSLWAWHKDTPIRADERDPFQHTMLGVAEVANPQKSLYLESPYVLLHYSWRSRVQYEAKQAFYRGTGEGGTVHPFEYGGRPVPLPDYAHMEPPTLEPPDA